LRSPPHQQEFLFRTSAADEFTTIRRLYDAEPQLSVLFGSLFEEKQKGEVRKSSIAHFPDKAQTGTQNPQMGHTQKVRS
jgi:hypothetical protein